MNLVYRYFQLGIEGYPSSTLNQILEGAHVTKVRNSVSGMIMLDNGKIIKCVKDYYDTQEGAKPLKKMANQCYYIQNSLDIKGVSNYQCARCHLTCSQMIKDGRLIRKS